MHCSKEKKVLKKMNTLEKESMKSLGIPITQENFDCTSVINTKKRVMAELRRGSYNPNNNSSSSESEKESEINDEVDGLIFGVTPPREKRRYKNKIKDIRFMSQPLERGKNTKKGMFSFNHHKEMKETRLQRAQMDNVMRDIPRSTQLIRVNSTKSLRSITQKKASFNSKFDETKFSPSVVQKTLKINNSRKNCKTSKPQFHKSFSLMVKLGGRTPIASTNHRTQQDSLDEDDWQVEYPELLWLELQAWHVGKSVEEEDMYLTEARREIDRVLDEVINYKFKWDESLAEENDEEVVLITGPEVIKLYKESYEEFYEVDDEFINMKINEDTESKCPFSQQDPLIPCCFDKCCDNNEKKKCEISKTCYKKHVAAMKAIIHLLKKVEDAEKLYPSLRALTEEHPKYKDVMFNRNMKGMILWLNINKELFHKLNILADWIDIDPDDMLTWNDWFQNGLGLNCVKTKQSYADTHYLSTGDMIDSMASSANLSLLASVGSARRSKRDKRKRLSEDHRNSFLEETSTSRYRPFIEKGLRDGGVNNLITRIRRILIHTIEKTRLTFLESRNQDVSRCLAKNLSIDKQFISLLKYFKTIFNDFDYVELYEAQKKYQSEEFAYLQEGQWGKVCDDMCLPSVLDIYIFLIEIPMDIIHECIRFRLNYKPKVQPSQHSISQLIIECKEVLLGGILSKHFINDVVKSIGHEGRIKNAFGKRLEEYDDDLKSVLNLYFDYLQSLFKMLQNAKSSNSGLKSTMEAEWTFLKKISPFIKGAEVKAGYKFCFLVVDMLKNTGSHLEESVEIMKLNQSALEEDYHRQKISTFCGEYKDVFKEIRERALQALSFAKLLQKDLGVATQYGIKTNQENILKILHKTSHVKVEFHCGTNGFSVFVPNWLSKKPKLCLDMMTLTFGNISQEEEFDTAPGYILLLKHSRTRLMWKGKRCQFENASDFSLALSYIKQTKDIMLVCKNSFFLKTQRKHIEEVFEGYIEVATEQTSSHDIIGVALHSIKESALHLADVTTSTITDVSKRFLDLGSPEMDEADRNTVIKSCIETVHACFSFGFEFLREVVRLFHGNSRINVVPYILTCAKLWMEFVMTKTERGRGTRPRWAAQGLEFLMLACDPANVESLTDEEFMSLQSSMQDCLTHIIGHAEPKRRREKKNLREKRSNSPFAMHRSRSVPTSKKAESPLSTEISDRPKTYSLPAEFGNSPNNLSVISMPDITQQISAESDSSFDLLLQFDDLLEEECTSELPMIRLNKALQEIDERRTAKLQHMRVIGNVTSKKPNFASQLVHLTVRRVNFKWQLGNKIGEGQFGKVYSSVNLDTGELMAVKQIRFNPHDYGTIQEIADEITNIQGVQHDSLVKYFGVELHKDEMLIFMEFCADGTIAEISKLDLPESIIRVYTHQITKAINFLHENGIIHRDIKGANIFVSSSGLIKIGDFGSAVKLKDAMATTQGEVFSTRGTAAYMAPEVITLDKGKGYGRAADIWSLGCVIVEMTTGKQPWVEFDNIYAIMFKVGDGQHPPIPERLSEEGEHFLKSCFVHDQRYRWTAHMLEDHPFVKCC